jgi:two-component system, NtrC family, response regulator AtoC
VALLVLAKGGSAPTSRCYNIKLEKGKMGKSLPNAGNSASAARATEAQLKFVEGASASMRAVEAVIRELAPSDLPVLLLAEPGAGKLTTAQRIHEMSRRNSYTFRSFLCANLKPEDLADLQGNGEVQILGTIYLEELADLNADCQAWLLKALPKTEEKETGAGSAIRARLICGSARDLEVEVKMGRLREDLYYRVSGMCLRLPPLRQRKEDIPVLLDHFLRKYAEDFHRTVPQLSAETKHLFLDYAWPGNLHELEDAAKVLVALGDETVAMGGLRALLHKPYAGSNGGKVSLKEASRAASREAEKELILKALTRTRWNRRRAAQELQISYKALLYKLKQIGYEGYGAS